jgi:hypothetical protein
MPFRKARAKTCLECDREAANDHANDTSAEARNRTSDQQEQADDVHEFKVEIRPHEQDWREDDERRFAVLCVNGAEE